MQILHLISRNFGIKPKAREPDFYIRKMEENDREIMAELFSRYDITRIVEDYPDWMIEMFRKRVTDHLQSMLDNITHAYTIWATNLAEADDRRLAQDRAISACEMLKQDIELVADVLPVKADKLLRYIDALNREIALLKGWRKSDNKRRKTLK